ncbi:acyltransferase [Rhodobacteraceae bacterium]|nr:acyltransferase [Paracoccaceae bacterium]
MTDISGMSPPPACGRYSAKPGRIAAIEWAKLAFAMAIVCLHVGFLGEISRPLNIAIGNNFARLGVPFFLFVTGFYFHRQVARGIGHMLRRMAGLYALWTVVYLPVWLPGAGGDQIVTNLIVGYWQLWYLLAAFMAACMVYLVRDMRTGPLLALSVAILMLGVGLQYAQRLEQSGLMPDLSISRDGAMARNFLFFGFPFMSLGLVCARHQARWRALPLARRLMLAVVALGAFVVEILANNLIFNAVGPYDLFVTLAIAIPALFLVLADVRGGIAISPHWSTAVYLVHVLWIEVSLQVFPQMNATPRTVLVVALSLSVVPVLRRLNRALPVL